MSKSVASSAAVALFAVASFAQAQTVVLPPVTESATNSGVNTAFRSAGRTYQEYIAASQLGSLTQPINITGIQFRLAIGENWRPAGYVGTTYPSAPLNFADYTITLAQPSAALVSNGEYLLGTETFASQVASPVVVRSGALTIPANSFTADGGLTGIHSFGPAITFTTPYAYTPGSGLVLQINNSGSGVTFGDAFFATAPFAANGQDAISSTASGTAAAATGFSSPYIVQFTYTTVPEPTSLGLLGLGGLAMLRRRRA